MVIGKGVRRCCRLGRKDEQKNPEFPSLRSYFIRTHHLIVHPHGAFFQLQRSCSALVIFEWKIEVGVDLWEHSLEAPFELFPAAFVLNYRLHQDDDAVKVLLK